MTGLRIVKIGTSAGPPFVIVIPPPAWPSSVAQLKTGTPAASSCLISAAYSVLSNPEPNAASGLRRTTLAHAAFTLAGEPSLGTILTFQSRTLAALLIASAIVVQTSTPQWTYVTVFPVGAGSSHAGRPMSVGNFVDSAANDSASLTPSFSLPVEALLAAAVLGSSSSPQAATVAPSAAVAISATARRRNRRPPGVLVDLML